MPVEREKWSEAFTWYSAPDWPCPACTVGVLRPKKNGLVLEETAQSQRDHEEHPEEWEPEWTKGRFSGLALCERCGEIVSVTGSTFVSDSRDPERYGEMETFFKASLFSPGPPLFKVPSHCPGDVRQELTRVWNLFWVDTAACANRIRSCVELVLTEQGIKRRARNKKGELRRLSLHDRVKLYEAKQPKLGQAMMAVKWIGNVGSHPAEQLSSDDLFDGLELLEHVLIEVYEQRTKTLERLGREIIRRKGRPKKTG